MKEDTDTYGMKYAADNTDTISIETKRTFLNLYKLLPPKQFPAFQGENCCDQKGRFFVCSPQRVCWSAILDEMKENEGNWLS